MVSSKNVLKLGGVAIAIGLGYLALKNSNQIGSAIGGSIGGGLAGGFKGLSDSFLNAFNFNKGDGITQTQKDLISSHGLETVDGINTENDRIVQGGGFPRGGTIPLASSFKRSVESGAISKSFAERFSFKEPAKGNQLDVSNAFTFISESKGLPVNTVQTSGGTYANPETSLYKAIEESANKYPEWFA